MISQTTTPARALASAGGAGGSGPLSSSRGGGRGGKGGAGGVRLLWRGAFEFGEGVVLDGIAFISHLSFPSATPSSSTAKLAGHSSASPIFPPRGSTATTPTTSSFLPSTSTSSAPPPSTSKTQHLDPSATLTTKPKPKRAVLFSSGIESAQSPSSQHQPTEGGTASTAGANNTPKAPSQFFSTSTIPSPSPFPLTSETDLLLSLALESLKGRPSIRYRGLVRIGLAEEEKGVSVGEKVEGSVEGEGGVRLYTDPRCPLVLNFLRRQLLSSSSHSHSHSSHTPLDSTGRTTHGILIGLGDESVESSNLIIYALSLSHSHPPSTTTTTTQPLTLHLGRYHPSPPTPLASRPRPDDPAPRRPPFAAARSMSFGRDKEMEREKRKLAASAAAGGGAGGGQGGESKNKRVKPNERKDAGRGEKRRSGTRELSETSAGVDTVVENEEMEEERDVFGSRSQSSKSTSAGPSEARKRTTSSVGLGGSASVSVSVKEEAEDVEEVSGLGGGGEAEKVGGGKGKEREVVNDAKEKDGGAAVTASGGVGGGRKKPTHQETHNKAHIKTAAIQALLEREITKDDPEFKELWNWVVRGSGFALRNHMSTKIITALEVQRVVGAHLELYLPAERA